MRKKETTDYTYFTYFLLQVEDLTENMRMSACLQDDPELERIPLTTDSSRLDQCVAGLREVLGPLGESHTDGVKLKSGSSPGTDRVFK